jgi:integrase
MCSHNATVTVTEAAQYWLQRAELDGLERSTLKQYREHADLHIRPKLGMLKLSHLSRPMIEAFKDELLTTRSRALTKAVLVSLKGIFKEARRRGLIAHDPAADVTVRMARRHKERVVIPGRQEIGILITKAAEKWPMTRVRTANGELKVTPCCWYPLIVTAALTGLRCSELRGLTWEHVDFAVGVIRVRQRADLKNVIGPPKSEAGRRDVPMSPAVTNTLKTWKLACPVTKLNLVFPSSQGGIIMNATIHHSAWGPLQHACALVKPRLDAAGAPMLDKDGVAVTVPRYTFHSLRHFAASAFIEMHWSPKKVQSVMGHSSIQVTYDVYGHLLGASGEDDTAALALFETRLGL